MSSNKKILDDVLVEIEVMFGEKLVKLKDVLSMRKNDLVELDNDLKTDVDVFANGVLIGKGNIVEIDNFYAVKITALL